MKRTLSLICTTLTLLLIAPPGKADLQSDIATVLKDKALQRAEVGVQIVRLGNTPETSKVIFGHQSDLPLIPASNLKLVTTAAALAELGPEFKFRTLLLRHNNDLVLIGDGDPSLGDAELLRKVGWDVNTVFKNWADQLKKAGLAKFDRLVVDDSIFDEQTLHPSWPLDQAHKRYVAQVGGLNLNGNCVDFYIRAQGEGETVRYATNPATKFITVANACVSGSENAVWLSRNLGGNSIVLRGRSPGSDVPVSVTVHDPSMFTATVLQETMNAQGVTVGGAAPVRDRTLRAALLKSGLDQDPAWQLLAIHETPLSAVLARANKDSVNLYAESLCKRLGAAVASDSGSWKNGTAALGAYLEKIGVPTTEFKFDDGCGLSKENHISANALCHVLAANWFAKTKSEYFDSLSVAGKDGTLETRFHGTDLRGRVFGKSGFVNNVRTLSGYVKAKDDQWYAFSILMNQMPDTATGKTLQELIVKAVDTHSREMTAAGQ